MTNRERSLEQEAWVLYDSLTDGSEKVKVLALLVKLNAPRGSNEDEADVAGQTQEIVRGINERKA